MNRFLLVPLLFLGDAGSCLAVESLLTPTKTLSPTPVILPLKVSEAKIGSKPTPSPMTPTIVPAGKTLPSPWRGVEKILGKEGVSRGNSLLLTFPRWDLNIMLEGVSLEPELGLTSRVVFTLRGETPRGDGAEAEGEIILLDREVPGILDRLTEQGFEVLSLRHFLLNESPPVKSLRFKGKGTKAFLAQGLKLALRSIEAFRIPPPPPPKTATPQSIPSEKAVPAKPEPTPPPAFEKVEALLGPGILEGRVLSYSKPREELFKGPDEDFSPESLVRFQKAGDKVVVAGELPLLPGELALLLGILAQNKIEITSLRRETTRDGSPVIFLNFWGLGDQVPVAKGVKTIFDKIHPPEKVPTPKP